MKLYGGIDLHSNNSVVVLLDEQDRVMLERRLANDLALILRALAPYQEVIEGLAVESTYHGYWLVDGLMAAGYGVHLVNTAAVKQYEGLKHTDDHFDACWLAKLLQLGVLPTGYIYPKQQRAVRDLLRKRAQLVRQKTANMLSIQNVVMRNTGSSVSAERIRRWEEAEIDSLLPEPQQALAVKSNLAVIRCLEAQIAVLEQAVLSPMKGQPGFEHLQSVSGIGKILALTILLEVGASHRFARVGQFASYCRCVDSTRLSNGKQKGRGNTKNGNRYLAWTLVEAAHVAVRFDAPIKRYDQRQWAKTNAVVATKAVAHQLARACYYVRRDQVAFDTSKALG